MRIWSSQQFQTFHIESAFDNYKCTTLEIFYNYIHGKYIWNSSVVMNFVCGLRCCNGRDWGKVLPCLQLDYSNSIRVGFRIVGPGSPSEFPTSRLNQKSKRNRQCHVDRHQRIGLPWERTVLIGLNWSLGELCVEKLATARALCIEVHLTLHSFCSGGGKHVWCMVQAANCCCKNVTINRFLLQDVIDFRVPGGKFILWESKS